jgi:hypothetical protein
MLYRTDVRLQPEAEERARAASSRIFLEAMWAQI